MADAPPPAESPPPNGHAPAKPSGPRPWQGGRFHPKAGRSPSGRRRAILVLVAVILALGGAAAAWLLYLGGVPHPRFEAITLDQYRDPRVPVGPWTAQDRTALGGRGWVEANAFTSQQRNLLVEELRTLGTRQPADEPLVIYLCAYALPMRDGTLAVLPGDADLDDESSWLPLREVFQLLKGCPVKKRLLLLDVMRPFADARAGALTDDAADRAASAVLEAREYDPTLSVLCACSPGQTSLASEEMGHTVFVHYLLEGLSGKADGWGGRPDSRVSARELAGYVAEHVDQWAWHNRGVRQTPVLLGPADVDFPLAVADASPPAADAPLEQDYPQWLREVWELRDHCQGDGKVWTPPEFYGDLEEDALRAEERWRAGNDAAAVEETLHGQVSRIEARRHSLLGATEQGEPRSLALAAAEGRKPPPGTLTEAIDALKRIANPAAPDADPAQLEARKKAFQKDYADKPFDLCWTVFQAARQHPETRPEQLRVWLSLLRTETRPAPDYAEIHFLEALAGLEAKDPAAEWPAAAVGAALELTDEAEQADAELKLGAPVLGGPLAQWLRQWREEAEGRRTAALDLLLNAKPPDRAKAAGSLDAVVTDARGYRALKEVVRGLRAASRCRDDGLTHIPGYAAYLEFEPNEEDVWRKAVKQTRALRDRLASAPAEGPSPEWLGGTEAQTRALRSSLDNLSRPLDSRRLHSLIAQSPRSGAADAEEVRAALSLPALAAADRLALWASWRELAGRLNSEAPAKEPEDLAPWDAEKTKRGRRDRALLRARASLALLQLQGAGDVAKAEAALRQASARPADDAALLTLGRELRGAWDRLKDKRSN